MRCDAICSKAAASGYPILGRVHFVMGWAMDTVRP